MHRNSAVSFPVRMREPAGEEARQTVASSPRTVPLTLRQELQTLDPKIVKAAIEKALTGGNAAAQVAAVKLLADIDAFGQGSSAVCARRESVDMAEGQGQARSLDRTRRGCTRLTPTGGAELPPALYRYSPHRSPPDLKSGPTVACCTMDSMQKD